MSTIWETFGQTDKKAAEEGKWIPLAEGAEILARSPNSLKARETRRKIEQRSEFRVAIQRAQRKRQPLPVEIEDKISKYHLAEGVLLDWRGPAFVDRAGKPLPFSPDNAIMAFEQSQGFFEAVLLAVTEADSFNVEDVNEEDEGNSRNSSGGISSGAQA